MKERPDEKLFFKARKMPESFKTVLPPNMQKLPQGSKGLFPGVGQSLTKPEKVSDAQGLLLHLQRQKAKKEKKGKLRNKSLEDIDPDLAFELANDPGKFGLDFKKYFSELQIKFAESFADKKAVNEPC
jgi:hypothetical protein